VSPKYRGSAMGMVSMGVSGSIALGVPVGLMLGEAFAWRASFVLVVLSTILSMVGVHFLMERVSPRPAVPLKKQLASLKDSKILFAHLTMFLFLAGHTVLYAYFKPFLTVSMDLGGEGVRLVYL